jgi:signal transduction histidine kinase/ligand-binding sensor domain-containing protein/CheY-like chemotaxis protein
MRIRHLIFILWWIFVGGKFDVESAENSAPISRVNGSFIKEWLLLGPMLTPDSGQDFFSTNGGLSNLRPKEGDSVSARQGASLIWKRYISEDGLVSFQATLDNIENSVGYAYCQLESGEAGEYLFELSARVGISLFVNGREVNFDRSRSTDGAHSTAVPLVRGTNSCWIKLPHDAGFWDFALKIDLANRALVTGKITDPAGNAVSGASVQVRRGDRQLFETKSNAGGNYRLDVFSADGAYDLRAVSSRLSAWQMSVELKSGDSKTVNLRVEDISSVAGTVFTLDGQTPQSGIVVQALQVFPGSSDEQWHATALTNERGEYQFIGLKPGRFRVRCLTSDSFVYYHVAGESDGTPGTGLDVGARAYRGISFRLPQFKKGTWQTYSTYDGLPYQNIAAVQRTRKGVLYLGFNAGGLASFDGREFKSISDLGIGGGYVRALEPASDRSVWIGSGDGLVFYDGRAGKLFKEEDGLVHKDVRVLCMDRDGLLWIGTRFGLSTYDGKKFVNYRMQDGLAGNWITDICEARDGSIWFATTSGVSRFDRGQFTNVKINRGLHDQYVTRVCQSQDDAMWFGTHFGVVRYRDGEFVRFEVRDGLASDDVTALAPAGDSGVWVATRRGLSRYNGKTFVNFTRSEGLVNEYIQEIHQDTDGILWVGTLDGLARFNPGATTWSEKDGLSNSESKLATIGSIKQLGNDGIWVGTSTGVFQCDGAHLKRIEALTGIGNVMEMNRRSDGTTWLGGNGLWKYDGRDGQQVVPGIDVRSMDFDANGNIWLASIRGLFRYQLSTGEKRLFTTADGLVENNVFAVRRGPDSTMWVGTYDGMTAFNGSRFIEIRDQTNQLSQKAVWTINPDLKGGFHFGGSFVFGHYDGRKYSWLTESMDFPAPRVTDIAKSSDGTVWLSTENHGLIGFDGTAYTRLDPRDGVAGKNARAVAADSEGGIWVGTRDGGLTRYQRGTERPLVEILGIEIDDRIDTDPKQHLDITCGHRVTFRCKEIDFKSHPDKRQFLYQIKDSENQTVTNRVSRERSWDWRPTKAGEYFFEVQAIDRDLRYSDPQQLRFRAIPPWYLHAWIALPAGGGIVGLLLFSIVTGWRYVVHRREAERLQKQMLYQERHARESLQESNRRLEEAKEAAEEARLSAVEAKDAAELANRAKSIFLANMSHEIRTPLNAVLGYAQILQRNGNLDTHQRQAITTIERSGNHLLTLINEILDLSKIESGRMEMTAADFDLRELILAISVMFEPRCQQKRLKWSIEGVGHSSIPVRGDEGKLRQVLINLVGNAVKFTDRGSVTLSLEMRMDDIYGFEVVDSGPGIPKDMQKKILEPFTQGTEGKFKGGTGLGLAISRRQVELMGGELRLDSEVGEGSRFYFALQLPPAQGQIITRSAQPTRVARKLQEGVRVRALIVDDIADNRNVLDHLLRDLGVEVTVVETGEEAWLELRTKPFDIAFLDIQMPGMTGLDIADRVVREMKKPTPKLVAISASVLKHEQTHYAEKGFDAFIPKPFRFEQISQCLADLLNVKFEYEPETDAAEMASAQADPSKVALPSELIERLRRAAESYSVTDFEGLLIEVDMLGDPGKELARQLRELSRNIRMEEILKILNDVRSESQ